MMNFYASNFGISIRCRSIADNRQPVPPLCGYIVHMLLTFVSYILCMLRLININDMLKYLHHLHTTLFVQTVRLY